jgi:hypothetical protein
MRVLRTAISRAEPDVQEAGLLAAVGFEVANYLERVMRREAQEGGEGMKDQPRPRDPEKEP